MVNDCPVVASSRGKNVSDEAGKNENLTNEATDFSSPLVVNPSPEVVFAGAPVSAPKTNEPKLGPRSMIEAKCEFESEQA